MAFVITDRDGAMTADPPLDAIDDLIAELDRDDPEHPDVSVSHESGWTLSAFPSGRLRYENIESDDAVFREMVADRAAVRELLRALAIGDLRTVDRQPWTRRSP